MNTPTLHNFYALLRDAARTTPDGGTRCGQLNAFRALVSDYGMELNTDNLGAGICDKDQPFFWSRTWEAANFPPGKITFTWPALVCFELQATRENPFSKRSRIKAEIEVAVLDVLGDGCANGKCAGCEGRTPHQIVRDTEILLGQVLRYVGGSVFVKVEDDATGLYNRDALETAKENGDIFGYTVMHEFGAALEATKEVPQMRMDFAAKKLYGTAVRLQIPFADCEQNPPQYTLPSIKVTASCCM